MPTTTTAL